jgi:hypothetical protein
MIEKHSRVQSIIEKLLVLYIIINPLIDFFTGLYIKEILGATELDVANAEFSSTPGLYIRLAMLAVFGIYILMRREKVAIGTLVIMGLAFCASIGVLLLTGANLSLGTDVKYFIKYCYNIAMMFAYISLFRSLCHDKTVFVEKLFGIVRYTCIICSLGILIPYIFHLGFYTYADQLGYRGCRGYFYSGNDITAVLTVTLPIAVASFVDLKDNLFSKKSIIAVLAPAMATVSLLLIGSKTAFIAAIGTCALILLFAVITIRKNGSRRVTKLLWLLLVILIIFLILGCIVSFSRLYGDISVSFDAPSSVAEEEGIEVAVLSGRTTKLQQQVHRFEWGGPITWLFGIGRSSVEYIIEMDLFEVVIYYGIVGAAAMLWIYIWAAIEFIKAFLKKPDLIGFAFFMALGMTLGYLTLAGHVLFTVTSGQYFVLAIAFSRLYFADNADEADIKPKFFAKLLKA